MNKTILNIKNLKKNFSHSNGKVEVIKKLNFSLKKGELIALTGPSGSGKSTLLHLIALLEKPSSGKIIFFEKNLNELNDSEINKIRKYKISLIFQNNNLISDLNVIENVMLPLLIRGENRKKSYEKAKKILHSVNLSNRLNFFPGDLSGGEQQRVAIARSIAMKPKLILADEPTGNLDTENSLMISNILFKYVKEEGSSLIMVTHDPKLASKAKRKIKIKDGKIK